MFMHKHRHILVTGKVHMEMQAQMKVEDCNMCFVPSTGQVAANVVTALSLVLL